MLSAEWHLTELKLENGVLETEEALRPILHALLMSGTLPTLSLAGNRKLRSGAWALLAVFLKRVSLWTSARRLTDPQARTLRFLDLSDTLWDRKGIEYLVQVLNTTPIRLPNTDMARVESDGVLDPSLSEKPFPTTHPPFDQGPLVTPTRAAAIPEKPISIGPDAAEALSSAYGSFIPPAPLLKDSGTDPPASALQTLRMDGCGLRPATLEALAHGIRFSELKNISLRRNRIGPLGAVPLAIMMRDYPDAPAVKPLATATSENPRASPVNNGRPGRPADYPNAVEKNLPNGHDLPPVPQFTTSGGVTSRTVPDGYKPPVPGKDQLRLPPTGHSLIQDGGLSMAVAEGKMTSDPGAASIALQKSVRALDGVIRIGSLLTLDLKGNDIRVRAISGTKLTLTDRMVSATLRRC